MNKLKIVAIIFAAAIAFTACKNKPTMEAKNDAIKLSQYVDSVDKLTPVYTVENWATLDNAYQERALLAEKTITTLEAEDKEKVAESKAKYAKLKASYEANLKNPTSAEVKTVIVKVADPAANNTSPDYRQILRNRLFGEGKIGADMKFQYVTANNILGVYQNFVNTVADNKNNYSREDWDEIKVLYEALDTRKNAIEKDLATNDNMKIAGLKIKFASIKGIHRTSTKGPENEAAKQ